MHEEAAGCPRRGQRRRARPAPDAGDWYANLLWFDRRKCLLLTHAATLFSIFGAGVRAGDLRATRRLDDLCEGQWS